MVNKAVRVTKANGAILETQAKPFSASDLEADEVLIKNVAVASNPRTGSWLCTGFMRASRATMLLATSRQWVPMSGI